MLNGICYFCRYSVVGELLKYIAGAIIYARLTTCAGWLLSFQGQHAINLRSAIPSDRKRVGGTDDFYDPTRNCRLFDYNKNRDWAENLTIVMQLGLTMAGCIVFCFFVGNGLDKWLGFRGVFTTIFILLGVVGGANVCYRQILEVTEPKGKVDSDGNERNNT